MSLLARAGEVGRGPRSAKLARRWLGSAVCAAVLATPVMVTSPAPAQAADSVFYLSGTRNNPAPQQMIDLADIGSALAYFGGEALQIGYPAALFPFQGAIGLDLSVAAGVASLLAAVAVVPDGDRLVLIGVSQGDIVLSLVERALIASGSQRDVLFVRMAGPSGDTGVMGRNWGFKLPGLSFVTRPSESPFDQVVLNHEYDGLGHWPVHQLNVLAVLNAVMGMLAFHNPGSYGVDLSTFPESDITTTVNSLGATTTTYLIRATGLLPLLRPLQALGVDDDLLNEWQRVLKPIIDSAYEPSTAPSLEPVVLAMVRGLVNSLSRMAEDVGAVLRRIEAPRWPAARVGSEAAAIGENDVLGAVVPEPEADSAVQDERPALTGGTREQESSAVDGAAAAVVPDDTAAALDLAPTVLSGGVVMPELEPVAVSAGVQDVDPDGSSDLFEDVGVPDTGDSAVKSEDTAAEAGNENESASGRLADSPRTVRKPTTARQSPRRPVGRGSLQRTQRSSLMPSGGSALGSNRSDTTSPPSSRPPNAASSTGRDASAAS